MRRLLIPFIVICLIASVVSAQVGNTTSEFASAKEAYENAKYQQAIDRLAVYERAHGTSPRLESLRAMAFRDLNMTRETVKALAVYFKLTENKNLSDNATHKELIELRNRLATELDKERTEKLKNLEDTRGREADKIVSQLTAAWEASRKPSGSAEMVLAEEQLWSKVSESKTAADYQTFLSVYPKGKYSEAALSRFSEFDHDWRAVRNSGDPQAFVDYIKTHANSPLIDQARRRLAVLTELQGEWKTIEKAPTPSTLRSFMKRSAGTGFSALAANRLKELENQTWEKIRFGKLSDFQAFLKEFPDGARAEDAKALIAAITRPVDTVKPDVKQTPVAKDVVESMIEAIHGGHGFGGFGRGYGRLVFDGSTLQFTEIEKEKYKSPEPTHAFSFSCEELKYVKGKDWVQVGPKGKPEIFLFVDQKSEIVKSFTDKVASTCGLPLK